MFKSMNNQGTFNQGRSTSQREIQRKATTFKKKEKDYLENSSCTEESDEKTSAMLVSILLYLIRMQSLT